MDPEIPALDPEKVHIQKTPDERLMVIMIEGDVPQPEAVRKLPHEAIELRSKFEVAAAEVMGYQPGSPDRLEMEEFSMDAMTVNYTNTLGADGYSQYAGAILFWMLNKIDSQNEIPVYELAADKGVADSAVGERILRISNDPKTVKMLAKSEEIQRKYAKPALPRITTQRHLNDMCILAMCTRGAGEEVREVVRIITQTDIHAANSFLLWQISDLFRKNRQPDWEYTEECTDYMETVHSGIYLLGASEQPPIGEDGLNVLERGIWSGSLIYLRDLAASVTCPEAFDLGNRVLGEMTGIETPADRIAVLSHLNLVAEMDLETAVMLAAGTDRPGTMLMDVTHKGVWKTLANALDGHPEINTSVMSLLSQVRSETIAVQDPENARNETARKMRLVKNLDYLLQIPGLLSEKDAKSDLGRVFLAEVDGVKISVTDALGEVPDIVRMRLVLDSERFGQVLAGLTRKEIPLEKGMVHTDMQGETTARFDKLNPDADNERAIVDWVRNDRGNFGAVFYRGKTRSGTPMEIQIIPEKAYAMSWHSHQYYKQT